MKFTNPKELVGKIVKSVYSRDPSRVDIYFVSGIFDSNSGKYKWFNILFLKSHNQYEVGHPDSIETDSLLKSLNGEYQGTGHRYDWYVVEGKR